MSLQKAGCHENSAILAYISPLAEVAQVSLLSWRRLERQHIIPSEAKNHYFRCHSERSEESLFQMSFRAQQRISIPDVILSEAKNLYKELKF